MVNVLTFCSVGMATALPFVPPILAADELASLLAHVPFEDVR